MNSLSKNNYLNLTEGGLIFCIKKTLDLIVNDPMSSYDFIITTVNRIEISIKNPYKYVFPKA